MEKSIYTAEYGVLVELLRETREKAEVTQVELAERLGKSQSFVTKYECGERRIDIVQLRTICGILATSLPEFVAEFEKRISRR